MKRRHAILLLGGASSGAMSVGTGAFSSVEADRGVEVNVVEDDEAYLGLAVKNEIATVNRPVEVVEITNGFADALSLDVTVVETNEVVDDVVAGEEGPGNDFALEIGPGDTEPISITCERAGIASFGLQFSGETDGASVEKTRMFSIDCDPGNNGSENDVTDEVTKVKFPGNSEMIKILTGRGNGGDPGGTVTARVYCESSDDVTSKSDYTDVSVKQNLGAADFDGDCDGSVVGIEIEGIGVFEKADRSNGDVVSRDAAGSEPV